MTTEQFATKHNANLSDFIKKVMKHGIMLTSKQQLNEEEIPLFIKIAKSMKTPINSTIDIIISFEHNIRDRKLSLTVGGLSVTLELCELEDTLNVIHFLMDKYNLPSCFDKEDIAAIMTELSQQSEIYKCEMLYQHLQFNTATGELTIIENIVRGCSINVFKYIEKIQSLLNF